MWTEDCVFPHLHALPQAASPHLSQSMWLCTAGVQHTAVNPWESRALRYPSRLGHHRAAAAATVVRQTLPLCWQGTFAWGRVWRGRC